MSRIILPVMTLLALVAAGCGSAAGPQPRADRALPRSLAQAWATRASAIATAAAAGQSCRASQLASSLRDEIIADEGRVPARLQSPLVQGANALADRITCTPVQAGPPRKGSKPPHPKPPKPPHHHSGKKHGGPGGDQR